jgi:myo-inositol-1(or 4)-monophosphatase
MKYKEFLETAVTAAKKAADVHMSYFQKKMDISFKDTHYNMVTKADIEAEAVITGIIKETFHGHNILAEENKYEKTGSPYTWIIDPLDGTNNFAHGLPVFSVSIALAEVHETPGKKEKKTNSRREKQMTLLAGVVYDPTRDELFYASRGNGAFLNNTPIHVSKASSLRESILGTGFYYSRDKALDTTLAHIRSFFTKGIIGIRRMGSAALDLCNVACGRLNGFWEHYLSTWDFAAGIIILEEAGGKATDLEEMPLPMAPSYIVSSNGLIHQDMLVVVREE